MAAKEDPEMKFIMDRYRKKLENELNGKMDGAAAGLAQDSSLNELAGQNITSMEYNQFRSDIMPPHFSWYEKACRFSEKIFKIAPDKAKEKELQDAIDTAHLNITPTGASSFALLAPLGVILLGVLLSVVIPTIAGSPPSLFFIAFFVLFGAILMYPLQKMPQMLADSWRLEASNQMVLCVFYVVTFMRHTSNLELGLRFASNHLTGPLALDLKKVLWDVETQHYSTVKESLDSYLDTWRNYNIEFIESMHLIESSLYEGDESRRLELLDKSLDVMLEETYEKMLHYAHNLKSPITTLHMLGVILPILGLVILPLVVNFMQDNDGNPIVKWYHLAMFYNVALPLVVYYLGKTILASRPTGYGDTDITDEMPQFRKFKNVIFNIGSKEIQLSPLYLAGIVFAVLLAISLIPVAMFVLNPGFDFGWGELSDNTLCGKDNCFFGYKQGDIDSNTDEVMSYVGPYGLGATVLSFFFPMAFGLSIGLYYHLRTQNIVKIRENAKKLEQEFASALFQLGNRLGDGLPAELAFGKAAMSMEGTTSGNFFRTVSMNIRKQGMSVSEAIFNRKSGAITEFPSKVIQSSMKVLTQAVQKSPQIAAQAIINVSRYIKEMHRVNERLKDLLADIIASMKSQIALLAPAISGVVVGITAMITTILGTVGDMLENSGEESIGNVPSSLNGFFTDGISPYFFQIVVGIYVVQIVYILTVMSNGIENGSDKLNERYLLGKNLIRSTLIYVVLAGTVTVAFTFVANMVIKNAIGG